MESERVADVEPGARRAYVEDVEREIAEACGLVAITTGRLMQLLWKFKQDEQYKWLGFMSFTEWASSDRFPLDSSTACSLTSIYQSFCHAGGLSPIEVVAPGWTKVRVLQPAVRSGALGAQEGVKLASRLSTRELNQMAHHYHAQGPEQVAPPRGQGGRPAQRSDAELYDVKVPVIAIGYIHRRVRANSPQDAAKLALENYGKEDLFEVELGDPQVEVIEA